MGSLYLTAVCSHSPNSSHDESSCSGQGILQLCHKQTKSIHDRWIYVHIGEVSIHVLITCERRERYVCMCVCVCVCVCVKLFQNSLQHTICTNQRALTEKLKTQFSALSVNAGYLLTLVPAYRIIAQYQH